MTTEEAIFFFFGGSRCPPVDKRARKLSGAIQKDGSGDDHKAMDSTAKFFGHSGRLNGVGGALEKKAKQSQHNVR